MLVANGILCDYCGRFISYADQEAGRAIHRLLTPDSVFTREVFESYHVKCKEKSDRALEETKLSDNYERLRAENERLTSIKYSYILTEKELTAENAKLRTALEHIKYATTIDDAREWATAALEETK